MTELEPFVQEKLESANDVLDTFNEEYDPDWTFVLVSGGHDSLNSMHVTHEYDELELDAAVHINTGIGIPETREFARKRASEVGLEFIELSNNEEGEQYEDFVKDGGFPGPPLHHHCYIILKERCLEQLKRDYDGEIALITGVRRHESQRRMKTVPDGGIEEDGRFLWVNPLVDWTGLNVRRYRSSLDLPMNPVKERLEMSGECLCGAFANREELHMIELFYPEVASRIKQLEEEVMQDEEVDDEYCIWGHDSLEQEEAEFLAEKGVGGGRLCHDCMEITEEVDNDD